MFLDFLEKIGRKKIVLDRGPTHPEFDKAKPWMGWPSIQNNFLPSYFF
jgi:hypothetical protein